MVKTENNAVTKYVYGLGLIGEEVSGSFKVYHFDYRGSTVAITDSSCNITDTFTYDTYGKLTARTGTTKTPFLYNGRDGVMYEEDTGLIYMRARYYSPELRRFINADKVHGDISNALSLNRYAFCNGDPANGVDPDGLCRSDAEVKYNDAGKVISKFAIESANGWYISADSAAYHFGVQSNGFRAYEKMDLVEHAALIFSKIFYEYNGILYTITELAKQMPSMRIKSYSDFYRNDVKKVQLYTYGSLTDGEKGKGAVRFSRDIYGHGKIVGGVHTHGTYVGSLNESINHAYFSDLVDYSIDPKGIRSGDLYVADTITGKCEDESVLTGGSKRYPNFVLYLATYDNQKGNEPVLKKYDAKSPNSINDNIYYYFAEE